MKKFIFPAFLMVLVIVVAASIAKISSRRAMQREAIEAVIAEYHEVEVVSPEAVVVSDGRREVEVTFKSGPSICTASVVNGKADSEFTCTTPFEALVLP